VSYLDTRVSGPFRFGSAALLHAPPPAVLSDIPGGKSGTIATLKHMRDFVRSAVRSPRQTVRNKSLDLFRANRVPPRKWDIELSTLHAFVRDSIRYVKDPVGLELVQAPERTLDIAQGDCDDKSTLLAALLMSTGHPARFTAVGFNDRPYSHVLVEARSGIRWIPMETIIDKPMGWFPSGVTSKYSLNL
jgi:transglutaminase-like putative cysteine protease